MNLRQRLMVGKRALWGRDIEPELCGFPVEMQTWYRRANVAAPILNVRERYLRHEGVALRNAEDVLLSLAPLAEVGCKPWRTDWAN